MIATASYWELIAAKVAGQPESLHVAIENVRRWRADGHSAPKRLAQWESLLQDAVAGGAGLERLVAVLRSDDAECERLRDFDPFAGVLTREERRQARELCGYRH
jgi:hypothetical protein